MHYLLLAIALNLGKKNVSVMKINDMKNVSDISQLAANNIENVVTDFPDNEYTVKDNIPENEEFSQPYVTQDFAELLPEDEFGNVVKQEEEQGPTFLDTIKEKIVKAIDIPSTTTDKTEQVEGPKFFSNIKDLVAPNDKKDKNIAQNDNIPSNQENKEDQKYSNEAITILPDKTVSNNTFISSNNNTNTDSNKKTILNTLKDKTLQVTEKITSQIDGKNPNNNFQNTQKAKDDSKDIFKINNKQDVDEEVVKITGTLFDSELNNILKGEHDIKKYQYKNREISLEEKNDLKYKEDEDYQNFLKEREIKVLVKPEKIFAQNVLPREKKIILYRNTDVPEELLANRSFQNRHIPKIISNEDKEAILIKTIEYGMIKEFRAFMHDLRDANMALSNQYTLLTYAIKNKQYDIVKYLIHIGADVNKRDNKLDTPIFIAVKNNDVTAVNILADANANLDSVDILKRAPLIYCIEKGYENLGTLLIKRGADINVTNGIGEGTLSMAIRFGRNVIKDAIIKNINKQ